MMTGLSACAAAGACTGLCCAVVLDCTEPGIHLLLQAVPSSPQQEPGSGGRVSACAGVVEWIACSGGSAAEVPVVDTSVLPCLRGSEYPDWGLGTSNLGLSSPLGVAEGSVSARMFILTAVSYTHRDEID